MVTTDRTGFLHHYRDQDEEYAGPDYSLSTSSSPLLGAREGERKGGLRNCLSSGNSVLVSLLRILRRYLIHIVVVVGLVAISALLVVPLYV